MGKDLCVNFFLIKLQVLNRVLYQKIDSGTSVLLLTLNFRTSFLWKTSGKLLLEEHWILLQTALIAITNNISNANCQMGFLHFVFRITFGQIRG